MSVTFDKPYEEERPWGKFERFTLNEPSTVKILTVNPGEAFSLQFHHHRDEFWVMMEGDGKLIVGEHEEDIVPGKHYLIPHGTNHRILAGSSRVMLLEISIGDFDEEDIVHLEDKYNRS